MVQAPPSLLWHHRPDSAPSSASSTSTSTTPVHGTTSASGSSHGTSGDSSGGSGSSGGSSAVDEFADGRIDRLAKLKLKQKAAVRGPSFTSSPLSQRPLSPSGMSDSGSESSASTVAIDIPRAKHHFTRPAHTARRSISAMSFGETFVSSPSSEDENNEEYDSFTQPVASSSKSTLDRSHHTLSPSPNHHERRHSRSGKSASPRQTLGTSPNLSPGMLRSSQRRRSSGNFGQTTPSTASTPPASPSPSFFSSSFVGSYEESLLSGRMANRPTNAAALPFHAQLGVLGLGRNVPRGLKCPDHINISFGAYFWDMDNSERHGKGSPYVGSLDLDEYYLAELDRLDNSAAIDGPAPMSSPNASIPSAPATSARPPRFPGYRIPPKGQLQLVVKNSNMTAVKLFLVPYDFSDMPPGSKTFLRQKSYDTHHVDSAASISSSPRPKETLRYAIHLQFCAPPAKEKERGRKKTAVNSSKRVKQGTSPSLPRHSDASLSPARGSAPKQKRPRSDTLIASHIYLHKNIRIVFTSRALDLSEKLKVTLEGPSGVQSGSGPASPSATASPSAASLGQDRYSAYTGPGQEWEQARKRRQELDMSFERQVRLEDPIPSDPNAANLPTSSGSLLASSMSWVQPNGGALLNTPPSVLSHAAGRLGQFSSAQPAFLEVAADVPEPLTFQRSPTPATVPLPGFIESGLSISRPGSRNERRPTVTTSPERKDRIFTTLPLEGGLR